MDFQQEPLSSVPSCQSSQNTRVLIARGCDLHRPSRTVRSLTRIEFSINKKKYYQANKNNQRANSWTCLLALADVQRPKATRGSPADLVPTARITCKFRTQSLFRIRDEDQGRISIGTPFLAGPFLPKSAKCTGYCL